MIHGEKSLSSQSSPASSDSPSLEDLRKVFLNPPHRYRSIPFWAWNNRLDSRELVEQLRDMKRKGMGGGFPHSREGLESEYMGAEWMESLEAVCAEAEREGMSIWLYDEDRWPSGSAGGRVPAENPEFRAKGLTLEVSGEISEEISGSLPKSDEDVTALYTGIRRGTSLLGCRLLFRKGGGITTAEADIYDAFPEDKGARPGAESLENGQVFLILRIETARPADWFNGNSPPDNLNPQTVRRFIELTHEAYGRRLDRYFGATIPGIFTDEPGVHDRNSRFTPGRGWIPWTRDFAEIFAERRGYDPLPLIPYIFFNGSQASAIRHDYWRTVTELFCESFSGQIASWCERNKLEYTGHFLWENDLGVATRVCGAIMPNYRYQHVPGIDILQESIDEYITVKQCASVANQYGRERVLSETYGCTGWGFTFEGQKWLGDWQYVLGVTLRSQHLSLVSLRGCRKRDYPPVFNYNTCWWKYNRIVEDYFARIGAVMTHGRPVREILIIHPASSAWSLLASNPEGFTRRGEDGNIPEIRKYGDSFNRLLKFLTGSHFDYDIGDEIIISECGKIDQGRLMVGREDYSIVVLPKLISLLRSTLDLLAAFRDSGGKVIVLGDPPRLLEGRPAAGEAEWRADSSPGGFFRDRRVVRVENREELEKYLAVNAGRPVSIRNEEGREISTIHCLLKRQRDYSTLFIVNTDRNRPINGSVEVRIPGSLEEWNPLDGTSVEIPCSVSNTSAGTRDKKLLFPLELGPAGSKLYIIRHTGSIASKLSKPFKPSKLQPGILTDSAPVAGAGVKQREFLGALGPQCEYSRTQPNSLVLDTCSYRVGRRPWSGVSALWQAQRSIREELSMRPTHENGLAQRYTWIGENHPKNGTPVRLKFTFMVDHVPEKPVSLCIESVEIFSEILLNGKSIPVNADGWFLDREFDTVPLGVLEQGENELVLSCPYCVQTELEDCYILGDFGVSTSRHITQEARTIRFDDWCLQGFLHYCGSLVYRFTVSITPETDWRYYLEFGEFSAVVIEVRVNNRTAGYVPWKSASKVDFTDTIVDGENSIEIEVMGSPRNIFGPFHRASGEPHSTDYTSFRTEGIDYTSGYLLRPYGLYDQVRIYRER